MSLKKNTRLLLILLAVGVGMLGLSYGFVPLYRLFCEAIGTPVPKVRVGESATSSAPVRVEEREITIRFLGNTANQVPVSLTPVHRRLTVNIGEQALTAYKAQSYADTPIQGLAVHTVIGQGEGEPGDVSEYIDLQQCFCFEEQLYPANEQVNLPLSFHVRPELPEGIHTITFGYTLYESEE